MVVCRFMRFFDPYLLSRMLIYNIRTEAGTIFLHLHNFVLKLHSLDERLRMAIDSIVVVRFLDTLSYHHTIILLSLMDVN